MENTPTDCEAFLERLYPYLDGELDEGARADIERHLELCADCLRQLGAERDLKDLVRRKCTGETIPATLTERLRAAVRTLARGGRPAG